MASAAGRVREGGGGTWWSAPDLLQAASPAQSCSHAGAQVRDLVFETLELDADDLRDVEALAAARREVVRFDWNPATGELTYDTAAPTSVFNDLAPSAGVSAPVLSCESR